jgi:hypothetical protein
MSYGRRYRRKTPPRLRLRRPRPYIQPRPRGEPLARSERIVWWIVYGVLIALAILLVVLALR